MICIPDLSRCETLHVQDDGSVTLIGKWLLAVLGVLTCVLAVSEEVPAVPFPEANTSTNTILPASLVRSLGALKIPMGSVSLVVKKIGVEPPLISWNADA